jgi:hypothetical protein
MIQVIEKLDEFLLGATETETVYMYRGEESKNLHGFKVVFKDGKIRKIFFGDIDNIKKLIGMM